MPHPPQPGKSKNNKSQPRERRSRSRNTTPVSASTEASSAPPLPPAGESAYLNTPLPSLIVPTNISIEALIEKYSSTPTTPPSAASLGLLHDGIVSQVLAHVSARGQACDRSMRELARKRKERIEAEREREEQERIEEERKKREVKKATASKKMDREEMEDETRPPTVGAHGLARQDGVNLHTAPPAPLSPVAQVAASTAALDTVASPTESETSHQPPPAQTVAHYQSFGDDPTKFDDPTIYDIRELTPDMTDEEKKVILSVADFPRDDLHDLIPGTPPDMDFSSGKAANQVLYTTFQAYVEPYVRPLTEEDVAFLRERGDRLEPYIMPARGPLPYKEVWSREDGHNPREPIDPQLPPNEPRGSFDDMTEATANTDEVSTGPILARLLQAFRHEPNTNSGDTNESTTHENGDTAMTNGETTAGEQDPDTTMLNPDDGATFRPATYFPDGLGYKPPATAPRSYATLEQRTLQELRYLGFMTPEATPDYDAHYDDEVAARLRYLQSELQSVAASNGARKARVLELTEERMAMQEYATIADDLDTQINTAYLKRNRTMSKPKKGVGKPRPGGGAGGAGGTGIGVARNSVSEGTRMLMERRTQWKELIGPVVEFGQKGIPKDTVFDAATMEKLAKSEGEIGEGDGE